VSCPRVMIRANVGGFAKEDVGLFQLRKGLDPRIFLLYNRRSPQMCNHYLVDPVACTPASGWEKGQVENQVGLVRERFFTPRLRFKSYDELNAWLTDKCIAYTSAYLAGSCTRMQPWL
jgi:hypothetical protein